MFLSPGWAERPIVSQDVLGSRAEEILYPGSVPGPHDSNHG